MLESGMLAPRERASTGDTLAALGDPRFDPEHWHLPVANTLGFLHVPGGTFLMGSDDKDKAAQDREKPQHELDLPDFWLAKYQVTVAQFRAFVEQAEYKGFSERALSDPDTRPVRYVSWYNALDYCAWLETQLSAVSKQWATKDGLRERERMFWQGLASGKFQVSLPSEAEWEKAARGTDGRIYPWEAEFQFENANAVMAVRDTSAVGCFPKGVSPYGLQDMSGNVWEWTRTIRDDKKFRYPYLANDGRESLVRNDELPRVLRGGAFNNDQSVVRCAYRVNGSPISGNDYLGFRVVVSPILPA